MSMYKISGYWKDDPDDVFVNELVHDYDSVPEGLVEEDIFYFGLSEQNIIDRIADGEMGIDEFVITSYERVENG